MIFEAEPYLCDFEDISSSIKINNYNACFKQGILICPHLFYYMIIGNYSENLDITSVSKERKFPLNEDEKINYRALRRLLGKIGASIKNIPPLFITPHIFTKFISLLWDRNIDRWHYEKILDLLKDDFGFIKEEEIKKEEIIDFSSFKNKFLGISETSLLILKNRRNFPCILSTSGKILKEYREDFLYVPFDSVISFIKEEDRKNRLI